jgi:hypothetical protein
LIQRFIRCITTELGVRIYRVNARIASSTLPKFANTPKDLVLELPRRIRNPQCIFLGDSVQLGPGTFLNAVTHYPGFSIKNLEKDYKTQEFKPKISIGNRVTATGNLTIGAVREVTIEDDVLLASNVTILANSHGYENPDEPYRYQPLSRIAPVLINSTLAIQESTLGRSGKEGEAPSGNLVKSSGEVDITKLLSLLCRCNKALMWLPFSC